MMPQPAAWARILSGDWPKPWHLGLAAFAGLAQFAVRDSYHTVPAGILAGGLAAFAVMAITRYGALRPERIPVVEIAILIFYLNYGSGLALPPAHVGVWDVLPRPESYEGACALALAATVAFTIGFALAHGRTSTNQTGRPTRYLPHMTPEAVGAAAAIYLPISCAWVLALALIPSLKSFTLTVIVESLLGRIPLAVVATAAHAVAPSIGSRIRLVMVTATLLVGMMVSSMLSEAAVPLLAAGIVWWRLKHRLPLSIGGLAVAVFLVLQPVKGYYRQLQWQDPGRALSTVDAWQEAFLQASEDPYGAKGDDAARSRLSELSSFAYAVEVVPGMVPHTGGLAYEAIAIGMIPRLIWPEKPNMTKIGTDIFTITLGLHTDELADKSSVALPVPVHGYLEHGALGTTGWMAVMGIVIGWFTRFAGSSLPGLILAAIGAIPLVTSYASGFVAFVGSSWKIVALALGVTWLLALLSRLSVAQAEGPAVGREGEPGPQNLV